MITAVSASAAANIPNWFVVLMGIGTVFAGLIAIIVICLITGFAAGNKKKNKKPPLKTAVNGTEDPRVSQELIAAVSAACAEDMGTDVSRIRVISFRKI